MLGFRLYDNVTTDTVLTAGCGLIASTIAARAEEARQSPWDRLGESRTSNRFGGSGTVSPSETRGRRRDCNLPARHPLR